MTDRPMRPAARLDSGASLGVLVRPLTLLLALTAMGVFTWLATKNSPQFNIQYAFYAVIMGFFAIAAK